MASTEHPQRGEIWLVALDAARAGELGENRAAVVISANELPADADDELIVGIVPLSSDHEPSALCPPVPATAGIDADSVAIPQEVSIVSGRRLLRPLGRIETGTLAAVDQVLAILLGIDDTG